MSRVLLRAVVVLFALAGLMMLIILVEAHRSRVPQEVLQPVQEQDIRWLVPAGGDAGARPEAPADVVHRPG